MLQGSTAVADSPARSRVRSPARSSALSLARSSTRSPRQQRQHNSHASYVQLMQHSKSSAEARQCYMHITRALNPWKAMYSYSKYIQLQWLYRKTITTDSAEYPRTPFRSRHQGTTTGMDAVTTAFRRPSTSESVPPPCLSARHHCC